MKTLMTFLTATLLTSFAFATSMKPAPEASADGSARVEKLDPETVVVTIKGEAAKLLYFSMHIAPLSIVDHWTQLPLETKTSDDTVCRRSMNKDASVSYDCDIYPLLKK